MIFTFSNKTSVRSFLHAVLLTAGGLGLATLWLTTAAAAQDANLPKETVLDGYAVHQWIDLGGNIAETAGSGAMYDTLVNQQSGPRVLTQSLDLHAVGKARYPFFDTLATTSTGYGGGPINFTTLSMSKGKLYNFQGLYRRDRSYFDYNLLDNPLIPPGVTSNGYTFPQVEHSPHLFNTVRRMLDTNLTLFPLAKVSYRVGYSHNINQGPSYSSMHNGSEAQFLQNWRTSTDSFLGAVDWKATPKTRLTYEEYVLHYKGDTNLQLTGINFQLPDGTPVSIGYDQTSVPTCTGGPAILDSTTNPPTINPTCSGWIKFSRVSPTRILTPTEEFLFQSSDIKNVQMNGSIRYTGATMKVPHFVENFLGQDNQGLRSWAITGYAKAERVNVSADYGIVWQMSKRFSLSDQFDFWNFRQPADSYLSEVDQLGTTMALPPGPPQPPVITSAHNFLGQKTTTNTLTAAWKASTWANISLAYRYRVRTIGFVMPLSTDALPNGTSYTLPIHENAGLLGVDLRPTHRWTVNGNIEAAWDDTAYTQISPRQLQHYTIHTAYKPRDWATISGAYNDLERRDNVTNVNHKDHNRSVALGTSLTPNVHYGVEVNYGYNDVFSQTGLCYASTPPPAGAGVAPADCGTNTVLGTGYYNAPTQYGSFGVTVTPVEKVSGSVGYHINKVSGSTETLNPRQVPGSLDSSYQTPYVDVAWTMIRGWSAKADWNYYGYGESGPVGPTLPRTFHGNIYTLAVHHAF